MEGSTPWVDGNYWNPKHPSHTILVHGQISMIKRLSNTAGDENSKGTWKYGDFGEAHQEVYNITGVRSYNVAIRMWDGKMNIRGVLSQDGTVVTFWNWTKEVARYQWISEQELKVLKEAGDPADAPPNHYKIQPDKPGKLIFISGAPGLGKSTTGHLLSKIAGYVYYEADCFSSGLNPYIPPESKEPSLDHIKQRPLKGIPQDRIDAVTNGIKDFMALVDGKEYDLSRLEAYYSAMCKDIAQERKRMGGDWVVAQAVPFRSLRNLIRAELGTDLVFVVLNMSKEDQEKRITSRHGKPEKDDGSSVNDWLIKLFDIYEPATEDEQNAINLMVTADMTREEVAKIILKTVNE